MTTKLNILSAFAIATALVAAALTPAGSAYAKNGHGDASSGTSGSYSVVSNPVHGPGSSHNPIIVCNSSKCPNQPPPRPR